ncbi:MAG: hypothetical protein IKG08_00565 [Eubacterium sp.]|nr:hypothetical protein [Eubacterium sp.]
MFDGNSLIRPVTDRIHRIWQRFKDVEYHDMWCDSERTRILTESYKRNAADFPLIRRAKFFRDLCEQMTVRVEDEELIVGNQGKTYRALSPYVDWGDPNLFASVKGDDKAFHDMWQTDGARQLMTDEDREYFASVADFWKDKSTSAHQTAALPESMWTLYNSGCLEYLNLPYCNVGMVDENGVQVHGNIAGRPEGHYCANYDKFVHRGLKSIKEEAEEKMKALEGHCYGDNAEKYLFYRSISIVCEGMITLAKRYGAKCAEMAEEDRFDEKRKAELRAMAESFSYIVEYPCKTFWDAMQAINFYMFCQCPDGQNHGVTYGRIDQYAGHFLDAELAAGTITEEFAQEITDSFILKGAEYTRSQTEMPPTVIQNEDGTETVIHHGSTIESGQHFSVGGVDKDGNDACNELTFNLIQCYARLYMYSPSLSVRVHAGLPERIWKIGIESSSICGGMPTFENDDIIIPALLKKGYTLEDARNYCLIGCVEPSGCGNEWPCCGATGGESFWNIANAVVLTYNNGINPFNGYRGGPETGYLYEMESMEDVKKAFRTIAEFYLGWHVTCANLAEIAYRYTLPCPVASATIDGCMESGKDVTYGGAKYNSTGVTCTGIGNVADSFAAIEYLCFDEKICTTRELYDALMDNWEGHEELRQIVDGRCPHYGNNDERADKWAKWAMDQFCDIINNATGPRGTWRPGTFTMTTNVYYGSKTWATPDGRKARDPLAEAISPKQGMDKHGPTAYLHSASKLPHIDIGNGDQLNIKFSKTVLGNPSGQEKIKNVIETFFDLGGMQVQFNVVSVDELKEAQEKPDKYKNLIVRIAGFSAAFVEMSKAVQDDFISRTEHAL